MLFENLKLGESCRNPDLKTSFCSVCGSDVENLKMQNQSTNQMGQTQKTVIPKVRYHPTIQTQTPGDGAGAKGRTVQTHKTRPASVRPPQTGTDNKTVKENQDAHKTPRVNPAVRPHPDGGQKQKQSTQKPVKRPVQKAAPDPDPAQTPDQLSDRAPLKPEQVPPGLGHQLDRWIVEEVEVRTRGQRTNQDWFIWRKNRITASVAHRIAHSRFVHGKSKTPPTSYLAAVTGKPHPPMPAHRRWWFWSLCMCLYGDLNFGILTFY